MMHGQKNIKFDSSSRLVTAVNPCRFTGKGKAVIFHRIGDTLISRVDVGAVEVQVSSCVGNKTPISRSSGVQPSDNIDLATSAA
jgi:hypothetical protein